MKLDIGINEDHLKAVAIELNNLLADEIVLYKQTRNYHWNIEGTIFNEMHLFFEKKFTELEEIMDAVAERIRMIGHYAVTTLIDYLKLTHLVELHYTNDQAIQLKNLLAMQETVIGNLRGLITTFGAEYKNECRSEFVTQLLGRHEKMA